jgi:gluconate 2-dehydrogenase alpha chain
LRTNAAVTRINLDSSGKKAVSVTYIDQFGMENEQPADLILLTAFTWSNVQLLLVSGIGRPYDPHEGTGLVGKNYSWHGSSPAATLFFDEGHYFNRFIGAGGLGTRICDFQGDNFDHAGLGFIGGSNIGIGVGGNAPLTSQPVPADTPLFGSEWKRAVAHYYNRSFGVSGLYDNQSYRGHYLDLDPNYKDIYGLPLLRVTFDNMPNEKKAHMYLMGKLEEMVKEINPTRYVVSGLPEHFDAGAGYGVVHQVGGAITGESPDNSVVNKFQQSWDVPNLFVVGASAFPQIPAFNPTGHVGAMAYFTADAIANKYRQAPGPLV